MVDRVAEDPKMSATSTFGLSGSQGLDTKPSTSAPSNASSGPERMETDAPSTNTTSNNADSATTTAEETSDLPPPRPNAERPVIKMSVDLLKTFNLINQVIFAFIPTNSHFR
jgi:hypothetical protein